MGGDIGDHLPLVKPFVAGLNGSFFAPIYRQSTISEQEAVVVMKKLAIYDPAMCGSTGVCGPSVDPVLPRVTADPDWLKRQGVAVERDNLAQQPQAFASNPAVTAALREHGKAGLPLIVVDGEVACGGGDPERPELGRLAGVAGVARAEPPKRAGVSSCCSWPSVVTIGGESGRPSVCGCERTTRSV